MVQRKVIEPLLERLVIFLHLIPTFFYQCSFVTIVLGMEILIKVSKSFIIIRTDVSLIDFEWTLITYQIKDEVNASGLSIFLLVQEKPKFIVLQSIFNLVPLTCYFLLPQLYVSYRFIFKVRTV